MSNENTLAYVVKAILSAKLERNEILAIARTMKDEFGVTSEEEAEELVRQYLKSIDGAG